MNFAEQAKVDVSIVTKREKDETVFTNPAWL